MSCFSNPQIGAIDDALSELEPSLEQSGCSQGFILTRSHEGSFNVPRRWLHRESAGIRQEIGLIIASPMTDRLERGFYPEIPCTLYVAAFDAAARKHYHSTVFESRPFSAVKGSLSRDLIAAIAKLDACTPEFIARYGVND